MTKDKSSVKRDQCLRLFSSRRQPPLLVKKSVEVKLKKKDELKTKSVKTLTSTILKEKFLAGAPKETANIRTYKKTRRNNTATQVRQSRGQGQ